jgi:hypothetical protein
MQYVYQATYRWEQYNVANFNSSGLIVASFELVYSKMFQRQHERFDITSTTSFEIWAVNILSVLYNVQHTAQTFNTIHIKAIYKSVQPEWNKVNYKSAQR